LSKATVILLVTLFGITSGSYWASRRGWGARQPVSNPVSIREGSLHQTGGTGHTGTRYFLMGGGIRGGK